MDRGLPFGFVLRLKVMAMDLRLCVTVVMLLLAATPDASAHVPRFEEVSDDTAFPVSVPGRFASRRGYLVVAENRADPRTHEIRLPVAIVRGQTERSSHPLPPVVFLSGGPGIGSLAAAAYPGAYPWTASRDFIVFGKRGTVHADPALMCPEYIAGLEGDGEAQALVEAARNCRSRFDEAGIDPSAYHTAASARDMEDLRRVLGMEAWSLYGLSYGTRLALTYARDFPNAVASMVLDSPLPHGADYDDESAANYQAALMRVAKVCEAQPRCDAAYPDVFARFASALEEVRDHPWTLQHADGAERPVTRRDLATIVSLDAPGGVAEAPFLMDAVARGDRAVIEPRLAVPGNPTPFAWGMRLSVWCAEALPYSQRAPQGNAPEVFGGLDGAVVPPSVCAAWDVPQRPAHEVAPTTGPVPTLIIAGAFDPDTPPKWAHLAARTLSRAHVVEIPYGLHTETTRWSGDGCAMAIAARFFADPKAFLEAPTAATTCIKDREPPRFKRPASD